MHTVELLEQLVNLADQLGYQVRHEWLGGQGGGACEFRGQRWIFIDLSLTMAEQLDQLAQVLRHDPSIYLLDLPVAVQRFLDVRRSA